MTSRKKIDPTERATQSVMSAPASRRVFLAGATAAGIGAIAAFQAPAAAALAAAVTGGGAVPVKMVACLRRRPDLSEAEFYDYWLNQHAPLAKKLIQRLGGTRYVQSHTSERDLGLLLASSRGQVLQAFDGVTEVWFPSREELEARMSTPSGTEANLRLAQDETNFIDLPRSSYFFTTEHVILG